MQRINEVPRDILPFADNCAAGAGEGAAMNQRQAVYHIMIDGRWRTPYDLVRMIGGSDAGITARLRDLRKPQYGSHIINRRPKQGTKSHEYQLIATKPGEQMVL